MTDDDTVAIIVICVVVGIVLFAGLGALIIAYWNYPNDWSYWHHGVGQYPHHDHDIIGGDGDDFHHHHDRRGVVVVGGTGLSVRSTSIASMMSA
jgi:hypothetical protein